ncbi:hypothetical protein D3C85_1447130 [compost metagenome]
MRALLFNCAEVEFLQLLAGCTAVDVPIKSILHVIHVGVDRAGEREVSGVLGLLDIQRDGAISQPVEFTFDRQASVRIYSEIRNLWRAWKLYKFEQFRIAIHASSHALNSLMLANGKHLSGWMILARLLVQRRGASVTLDNPIITLEQFRLQRVAVECRTNLHVAG